MLTPRTITWTVLRRAKKRAMESQALLVDLRERSLTLNEAIALAEAFIAIVRDRKAGQLELWLK